MGNKKSMLRDRFSPIYEIHFELYKRVVKRIGRKINEFIVMFFRSAIIDWGLAVVINEQLLNRTKLKVVGSNPTGRRKFSRLYKDLRVSSHLPCVHMKKGHRQTKLYQSITGEVLKEKEYEM